MKSKESFVMGLMWALLFCNLSAQDLADSKNMISVDSYKGSENEIFHHTLSYEHLTASRFSFGAGLSLVNRGNDNEFGADFRIRYNLPGTLSPYAGLGFFTGRSVFYVALDSALHGDDFTEDDEQEYYDEYLNAFYPEIGVNLWLSDRVKLNAGVKYFAASKGHDASQWMGGLGVGVSF